MLGSGGGGHIGPETILASVRWRNFVLAPRPLSSYVGPTVHHGAVLGEVSSPNLRLSDCQNRELERFTPFHHQPRLGSPFGRGKFPAPRPAKLWAPNLRLTSPCR